MLAIDVELTVFQLIGVLAATVMIAGAFGAIVYTIRSNSAKEWRDAAEARKHQVNGLREQLDRERRERHEDA